MTPETRVKSTIMDYLLKLKKDGAPIFYDRRQAGSFNYKKGIPDIYVVYYGIHIEVEVKAPGGHLSTMQEKYRDVFKKLGIRWICVENVEELKKHLEHIERISKLLRTLPENFWSSNLIPD